MVVSVVAVACLLNCSRKAASEGFWVTTLAFVVVVVVVD